MEVWLFEFAKGIGKFFLHPLLYLGLFYAIGLGYVRVKRERKDFKIRVQDGWFEFRQYLSRGWPLGLIFSFLIFMIGFTVPVAFIIVSGVLTLLLSLFLKPAALSPAYTAGMSFFLLMVIGYFEYIPPFWGELLAGIDPVIPGAALITGFLLLAEGILIYRNGSINTSPKIVQSHRGMKVGVHESKRLWFLPVLLLIPGGALSIPFDFWPVLPIAGGSFSILLVPFWIGFGQQIRMMLPETAIKSAGKQVIWLSVMVSALAVAGYWYPILSILAAGTGIGGRLLVALWVRQKNRKHAFYFSKSQPGIVVLDIIPDSPAEKMEVKIGEVIKTVNGVAVQNEREFYGALQKNRAFCKLEVIDENGENRFVQRALYEGEHHELGVIFVDQEKQFDEYAV